MGFEAALGAVLREMRLQRGWTQAHFDGVVSPQYLSDIEFGKRSPSLAVLRGICAHLGVELSSVLVLTALSQDELCDLEGILKRVEEEVQSFATWRLAGRVIT
ncbi:helix-turn-helix domain-containing protein [Pseudomonas sp. BO3-4]|uniref:helix-turn-helix domain-containing protein n=1 Tax=Pseudomonas sp. BO3-4 TaxID=3094916 RepID=UPI003B63BD8E